MNRDILELVFKHSGGVELRALVDDERVDTVVWASDSDPDFMDEFTEELLDPKDEDVLMSVMDFLVDHDVIDEDEADDLRIVEESLDGRDIIEGDIDPGDDDDGDEEDEDELRDRRRVGTANIGGGQR